MSVFLSNIFFFHSRDAEDVIQEEDFPKKLQEKLAVFKDIYPNHIVSVDGKRAFCGPTGSLSYEIQATPYIKDTWHELPVIDSLLEAGKTEVSNWMDRAEKEGFPKLAQKGPTNVVPKDISGGVPKEMLPQGVRVSFDNQDKAYENFLAGPALVKDGKMLIEGSFCQGPSNIKVNVDKNVVKTEKFARCGLRESYGVTYMLEMLLNRLKESMNQGSTWDQASELKLTQEWLELVLITSFRTSAFLQSIQVLSKDSLREEALDKLYGSFETKKNLRHSHYATSKVFGPLSAQFEPFVLPSSLTHKSYKLYPKLGSGGSFNQKDRGFTSGLSPNFSLGSGQYKRASNAQWDSSKNKKSRQSDNLVKSISPQEALRRSRENSGRQNQFFRGNQGRGKRIFQNSKRK